GELVTGVQTCALSFSNSGGVSLPSIGRSEQPRAVVNDFSGVPSLIQHLNNIVATLLAKCEPVVCSVLVSTLISPVCYAGANFYRSEARRVGTDCRCGR